MFRHTLTRRDAFLILLGAFSMHVWSILFSEPPLDHYSDPPLNPAQDKHNPNVHHTLETVFKTIAETTTISQVVTVTETAPSSSPTSISDSEDAHLTDLPATSIIAHAPGWTLFKNLYMSNGTLYILTPKPKKFPEIRMMASTPLIAENTPENIAAREPSNVIMDYITPDDALDRWGGNIENEERTRVWTVEGYTLLFNDPSQFLRHYYHLVAELFFGVQAFWHGAFSQSEITTPQQTAQQLAFSSSSSLHPAPPRFDRAIFAHSNADGWRDDPGFNSYFLRAAFPSLTVEHQEDWDDRIKLTQAGDRVWRFPVVLLTDRSAAHRGRVCGSLTQRTAAEAWEGMRKLGQLRGRHVGAWWEPVRSAIWEFAGVTRDQTKVKEIRAPKEDLVIRGAGEGSDEVLNGVGVEAQKYLEMPDRIVISYISRQGARGRRLIGEDHDGLVEALTSLAKRKNEEAKDDKTKRRWMFNVVQAETLSKDDQVLLAADTTIMLGVHGNGLTHLVWMKPSKISTVIEIFVPGGFAHDYQWTARALGMAHFAVWNDTHYTHPNKPKVDYPKGFQGNHIPVYGPAIAKLIEDRVEGTL